VGQGAFGRSRQRVCRQACCPGIQVSAAHYRVDLANEPQMRVGPASP
jgi:hypothetical protein